MRWCGGAWIDLRGRGGEDWECLGPNRWTAKIHRVIPAQAGISVDRTGIANGGSRLRGNDPVDVGCPSVRTQAFPVLSAPPAQIYPRTSAPPHTPSSSLHGRARPCRLDEGVCGGAEVRG